MSSSKYTDNDTVEKREKTWTTTTRPNPRPKGEFDNSVHMARHHARVQQKLKQNIASEELREAVSKAVTKNLDIHAGKHRQRIQRKRNNRTAYKQRTAAQLKRMGVQNNDLSSFDNKISLNVRVSLYARNHKCEHGVCHNVVRKTADKYVFSCLCKKSKRLNDMTEPVKCSACGTRSCHLYVNPATKNRFIICPRCKRSNFIDPAPHFYDVNEVEPGIVVTLDPSHNNPHQAPDVVQADFKQFLDKNVNKPSASRRDSRRDFFRSLQGKSQRPKPWTGKLPSAIKTVASTDQAGHDHDHDSCLEHWRELLERTSAELRAFREADRHDDDLENFMLDNIRVYKRLLDIPVTEADAPVGFFVRICTAHGRVQCMSCPYESSDESDVESEDQGAYESAPPAVTFLELISTNRTITELEAAYARIERACGLYNINLVNEERLT